jgi:hypothetical protein
MMQKAKFWSQKKKVDDLCMVRGLWGMACTWYVGAICMACAWYVGAICMACACYDVGFATDSQLKCAHSTYMGNSTTQLHSEPIIIKACFKHRIVVIIM